ncbi:MAG: phosphomethylpyrimidine synthase ThiC [Vallitaleaceae bacterium]|nr:phosphomethylpyrimidine synthase ThiC [Vallitaleaceae bacterium]
MGNVTTCQKISVVNNNSGIDRSALLELIEDSFVNGISFITIHPTTTRKIHSIAQLSRVIPSTSRGGMMVVKDMMKNNRDINIFEELFEDLLLLCEKYNIIVSIGTTYRPATVGEALDEVQLLEIARQKYFVEMAKAKGVSVMIEGIGHISLKDIFEYKKYVDEIGVDLMPLGPIITDSAIGFDHVASAIGSTFTSYLGMSNIINVVTRDEHTGGIPSIDSIFEGLKSAKVSARAVNICRFEKLKQEEVNLSKRRAEKKSCILSGGLFDYFSDEKGQGCDRCGENCPLL